MLLTGLGRVVQDFLLWCTSEFGYLRLADGFVQCSSIMPQKRNPVALEHARAIASKAVGQAGAILTAVHNTPFGDIVDTEDDLQPLVVSMFKDAIRMIGLVAAAMSTAEFDTRAPGGTSGAGMDHRNGTGRHAGSRPWRAVQEEPRDRDPPGGRSVTRRPEAPLERVLAEVSKEVLGRTIEYSAAGLAEVLSPQHFVRVRTTPGRPGAITRPSARVRRVDRAAGI